jgi:ATP-dependent Clp protease adaptor protein ClpS
MGRCNCRSARREITLVDVPAGMMATKGGIVAALLAEAKLDIDAMERMPVSAEISAAPSAESEYRSGVREPHVRVRVLNDDKSTMEGVLTVLQEVFAMGENEARHIMLLTHRGGSAIVGSYSRADAHERIGRATQRARELGMPLRFTISS